MLGHFYSGEHLIEFTLVYIFFLSLSLSLSLSLPLFQKLNWLETTLTKSLSQRLAPIRRDVNRVFVNAKYDQTAAVPKAEITPEMAIPSKEYCQKLLKYELEFPVAAFGTSLCDDILSTQQVRLM